MSKLRKLAETAAQKYGPGYENTYGQVTPYHILFKDHGNEIAALPKDHAVQFVISKIKELNKQFQNDPEYARIPDEDLNGLKETLLQNNDSGMDVLFNIKDMLLESEGAESEIDHEPEENKEEETPVTEEQPKEEPQPEQTQEPSNEPAPAPESNPEPVVEEAPKTEGSHKLKRLIKKNVK